MGWLVHNLMQLRQLSWVSSYRAAGTKPLDPWLAYHMKIDGNMLAKPNQKLGWERCDSIAAEGHSKGDLLTAVMYIRDQRNALR